MHLLQWSLIQGQAMTVFYVSEAKETLFLAQPDIMPEKMDPLFFNHKDNYIPHQYPCRKEFLATHLNQLPEYDDSMIADQIYYQKDNRRVEFSGFWFVPTYVKRKAENILIAPKDIIATFTLKTAGGVNIFVNGKSCGGLAKYVRNAVQTTTIKLPLQKGQNKIEIFFDELCERDTLYDFEIVYQGDEELIQAIKSMLTQAEMQAMQDTVLQSYFTHDNQFSGDVTLRFPNPLPFEVEMSFSNQHDFISAEYGQHKLTIAKDIHQQKLLSVSDLHDGYNLFHIQFYYKNLVFKHKLALETMDPKRQPQLTSNLETNKKLALQYYSIYGFKGPTCLLAKLASGYEVSEAEFKEQLKESMYLIENRGDCADFYLIPCFWILKLFPNKIPPNIKQRLEKAILSFRYWCDEKGNDVMWYYSENHALLFHTNQLLAGQFFNDAKFTNSDRFGKEQQKLAEQRLKQWFDHFKQWEMAEFNSAPYFPIDLMGFITLAYFAQNAEIKQEAYKALMRLLEIIALNSHQGILTAAQGRSYEKDLIPSRTLEVNAIATIISGKGSIGSACLMMPLLCLLEWQPPKDFMKFAYLDKNKQLLFTNTQGENHFARLMNYKTHNYAMASAQNYRKNEKGYQETLFHLRLSHTAEAQIWLNHPGEEINFGFRRPSFWGGSGYIPQILQYKALALIRFDNQDHEVNYSHCWFPSWTMDEVIVGKHNIFARLDQTYLRISAINKELTALSKDGDIYELRILHPQAVWLIRADIAKDGQCFNDWIEQQKQMPLTTTVDSVTYQDDAYGLFIFQKEGNSKHNGNDCETIPPNIRGEVIYS